MATACGYWLRPNTHRPTIQTANFVRTCLFHNNSVVQNVANYGVLWARCESPIGRNVMHCMRRYNAGLPDLLSAKFDAFIWKSATKDISSEQK